MVRAKKLLQSFEKGYMNTVESLLHIFIARFHHTWLFNLDEHSIKNSIENIAEYFG